MDGLLEAAGWKVQDRMAVDLGAGTGVADAPFHDNGGQVKTYQTFGNDPGKLLEELNEVLAA
jgi:hypothetical protein